MRIQFSKIVLAAFAVNSALSMAFAAGIPGNCSDEIIALSKGSGFDMQAFMTNLPPAVAKAKLQAKAPFGKPKDSDKTDIGMTFGCLKAFPESPGEIQSLLKDVSQKMVDGTVQPQYAQPQEQPQYAQPQYTQPQYVQPQYAQPQYVQPQVQYVYVPQPICPQCPQCSQKPAEPENFSTGQRWGTWFLNTILPGLGLGSAVVMGDYAGMGIQMALGGLGWIFITALGFEEERVCYGYNNNNCHYQERPTEFFFTGWGLLGINAIYNIVRSATYDKPKENYASNKHNGFNLAVLPNRHGEFMPYLMYNKTF